MAEARVESSLLLIGELVQSISSTDRAAGRRTCTRILNRWKKEILPKLSREEILELLLLHRSNDKEADEGTTDAAAAPAAVVSTFLSIINNDNDFPTEGHRETSVEILKGLFRTLYGANDGSKEDVARKDERLQLILIQSFQQCSKTFQKRMSRCCQISNDSDSFYHHGTATEPMESSEHIRLLLVELMLDLGKYLLAFSSGKYCTSVQDEEAGSKMILEATSNLCQTLARSTFLDPYPEVQRAACSLVEVLAQVCPLAVRMNATNLLVSLTGRVDDTFGGGEPVSASISKKCLFHHRHAKTRCKAVDASAAIVMCCPREFPNTGNDEGKNNADTSADHLKSYGSRSTSMEQILHDTLLPGWEDLLKMDSSASVQTAVLKSLGNVASMLAWRDTTTMVVETDADQPSKTSKMDLESMVEAKVLSFFLLGVSKGSVDQVRSVAVEQLTRVQSENNTMNGKNVPWHSLASHFKQMMEIILDSCSQDWAPCQSKVRSLKALQVLLSIAVPLMNGDSLPSLGGMKVDMSSAMVHSIMETLSKNILSEEKEVLQAALTVCRILGANNHGSIAVIESHTSKCIGITATKTEVTQRDMTCILLILDGMMKGSACTEDAVATLHNIDPHLDTPSPDWFHSSPSAATIISSLLCHLTVINNVATNSSLAWALVDATQTCVQKIGQQIDQEMDVAENVIINILMSITYLLGCPVEYSLSDSTMNILGRFSAFMCRGALVLDGNEETQSLLDVHFRIILPKIISTAPPFPWKQSDPSFLAMDALLRTCSGFTVGRNFDMVAPFFISHLSVSAYSNDNTDSGATQVQSLSVVATKDEMAEEYSLRISLMATLQTILSDESFSQTFGSGPSDLSPAASTFSSQFTTDVLLSLVLPNLVWKAGGMASALRKLAAATLFCLLSHYHNKKPSHQQQYGGPLHPETIAHLIPVLHSNLEDTESTTRELACVCLAMVLEQVSPETFSMIWETNTRVIDTLYPRLLELLDDSHDPVRMAACGTLEKFLNLAQSGAVKSSFDLGLSSLENITSNVLIQLDDPDQEIQKAVFQLLSALVELQFNELTPECHAKNKEVVEMVERQINLSLKSHRDGSFCHLLLEKVEEYYEWERKERINA